MNDYEKVSGDYIKTHEKPDKKYSLLPTFMKMAQPLAGKKITDVGCGDGFFTREFSKEAREVIGIDNSIEQIRKAEKSRPSNVKYLVEDMNQYKFSQSDLISVPFVLNYIKDLKKLTEFLHKLHDSLRAGGKIISIVDMPRSSLHDFKRYGSVKKVPAGLVEGAEMTIELYNGEVFLVELHSTYHTKENIKKSVHEAGFREITWHKPVVSEEGLRVFRKGFWDKYLENCDLAYFSANK